MKKSKVLIFLISVFMLCSCGNTIEELSSNANPQQKNDNNDGSDSSDTQDPQDTEPGNEQNTTKQWIVSYSSAHGTIPPAVIVDEGYILRQSDLPLLSVAGYIFDGWCIEDTKVIPDTYAVMQSVVVSAKWLTGNPTYKVRHYCKSLTQDNILVDEETLDGPSGTRTNAQPKDYYGFHPSTFSQSTINANNTTVVGNNVV